MFLNTCHLSSPQAENSNSINSIVCLEAILHGHGVVAISPTGFMESQSYFNCGCEAVQFHQIVIAVPPLNVLDVTDAKT